jgi:hypothetical protein
VDPHGQDRGSSRRVDANPFSLPLLFIFAKRLGIEDVGGIATRIRENLIDYESVVKLIVLPLDIA